MRLTYILLFLIAFVPWSYGQSETYKKAKIYLEDHQVLKVNNLQITTTSASFLNTYNNREETLSLEKASLIKKAQSSYFKEGALYGAGVMALTALIIDIQPDDPFGVGVERDYGVGFYIGMTAGGATIGALVGALFPKWRTIYSGGKFIGLNVPVNIEFTSENNISALKITLSL